MFQKVRQWLEDELKKAKTERPKNTNLLAELEKRIGQFGREIKRFKEQYS